MIATHSLSLKTYVPHVPYVVESFFDRLVGGEKMIATHSLSLKTYVLHVPYVVESFFDRPVGGER